MLIQSQLGLKKCGHQFSEIKNRWGQPSKAITRQPLPTRNFVDAQCQNVASHPWPAKPTSVVLPVFPMVAGQFT
jgi:hypothetical protein